MFWVLGSKGAGAVAGLEDAIALSCSLFILCDISNQYMMEFMEYVELWMAWTTLLLEDGYCKK